VLLAVSGQNVALIAGGAILLAYLIGLSRFVGQLAALAAIGGYVLAVGWQPSVVRAGVAGTLASLAWLASRPSDRWYFLLLGAALLMAWSPYSLLDAGFQLSFAAVAAIFVVVPRLQQTLAGYPVPHSLAEVIAVSGACGVATAPILLTQFGVVPLYSIPANALAAPVVAPLLGIALVTAIVAPVAPPLAAMLAWVNGWLAAYLAACARHVGGLPYAAVSAGTAVVIAALVLGAAYLVTRLGRPRGRAYAAIALAAALVAGGWRLHGTPPLPPPKGLRITFLDVGQGDGALIQAPGGAVLVDEGPPEAHMASQLRHLGVTTLSLIVLTHPQRDHIGGAKDVLEQLRVGAILDPAIPSDSPDERSARAAARKRGVRIIVARAGESFRIGALKLRVLWPDGPGTPGDDPNNHAVVLVASYGQTDALFTADAESDVTGRLQLPPVEILKVAHHGSADAGLADELKELRPRIAVISVGAGNDYGHPTASTLATLGAFPGLAVYRTDLNGRVVVESDGRRISVRTSR
jgi:competence protein ComEC